MPSKLGSLQKMEHELHEWTNGTNEEKVIYKNISFKIVESCFEVHNILGPGYSEKIYEEAVSKELRNRGIEYKRQKLIEVFYKAEKIGEYRLDMVVENKIILELKAVSEPNNTFEAQLLSYLKATGMKLGILVNFGGNKVEYKRIVN
jgi:GxxExxY protein